VTLRLRFGAGAFDCAWLLTVEMSENRGYDAGKIMYGNRSDPGGFWKPKLRRYHMTGIVKVISRGS
jgi:hypothetical protein